MRKTTLILILFMAAAVLTAFAGPVSAQDVDLSGMDDAQLMKLLWDVMQKLQEEDAPEAPADGVPEEAPAEETPVPVIEETPVPTPEKFLVYENKKLTMEKLPDRYFVEKEAKPEKKEKHNPGKKKEDHSDCVLWCYSQNDCHWVCD